MTHAGRRWALRGGVLVGGFWAGAVAAVLPSTQAPLYVGDELIVTWQAPAARGMAQAGDAGAQSADAARMLPPKGQSAVQSLGMTVQRSLGGDSALLKLPAVTDVPSAMALLSASPEVARVEPNYIYYPRQASSPVPSDTHWRTLWGLHNTGQANFVPGGDPGVLGGDLGMLAAWDPDGSGLFPRVGASWVKVAIIDDAFDVNHPDLKFVAGRNISQGGTNVTPSNSRQTHGTMVAGSLAAIGNNGIGVAGTTWGSTIIPVKIGSNMEGFTSGDIQEALRWVCDQGVHVVNASFGGPTRSQTTEELIRALGDGSCSERALFVTSAGNDDANLDVSGISYPTLYDAANIVNVAATNRQDDIASFSMYGPTRVHVAAAGLQVVTTTPGGNYVTGAGCGYSGGQCGVSGTSFSSPYVAGIAALIKAHVTPTPDWREVKARLIESGTTPLTSPGSQKGIAGKRTVGGRVDAARALDMAPRPAVVIESVRLVDDANQRLDPGESAQIEVTVRNIWKDARNVQVGLVSESAMVSIDATLKPLGDIDGLRGEDEVGASATAVFDVAVQPGISGHHHAPFMLLITAEDEAGEPYEAQRPFRFEVARLEPGEPLIERFQHMAVPESLYDEYHSWHVDVPAAAEAQTLIVQTRTPDAIDIDLLGRKGEPPQYYITLSVDPYIPGAQHIFCTSSNPQHPSCYDPDTEISGEWNGDEDLRFFIPAGTPAATYHFTVVNYAQCQLDYAIAAELRAGDVTKAAVDLLPDVRDGLNVSPDCRRTTQPPPSPPRLPSDDGGSPSGWLLLTLLGLGLMRRRRA